MSYIDDIAHRIYQIADGDGENTAIDLYRIYAVLCLSVGIQVTRENVHDAWSAWAADKFRDHRSLIPFDQLTPQVQALDIPYVEAIQMVALEMQAPRSSPSLSGARLGLSKAEMEHSYVDPSN